MDAITKLKSDISLVEHIASSLWQQWKPETAGVRFKASKDDKTPSLLVYKDASKWYCDFSLRLWAGTIIDFEMHLHDLTKAGAIKKLCEKYWVSDDEKKEFKKSPKRTALVENFEEYRMKWNCPGFIRFLTTRWVPHDFIQENKERIDEVAKEFWYAENIWMGKDKIYKDVIIFPCLIDEKINGAKLRSTDGSPFYFKWEEKKSVAVGKPYGTWILYTKLSDKYVLIIEWETDYMIMKILGFDSVIMNGWWVQSHTSDIQKKVKDIDKVVSMYDNDSAGITATIKLQEKIWRPIRRIAYKDIEGMDKYDINDLFKIWYRKLDFNRLIKESVLLTEDDKPKLYLDRFFYNNEKLKYFDVKGFEYKHYWDLARHLWLKPKELEELRVSGTIPTYEGICYYDWWKPWFYNLLDRNTILKPSNTPKVDKRIEFLIRNLCNNREENIIWLLKAITYKYNNLNDVYIPAIVFHGEWGTWKWLLMKLLSTIFWKENTLIWLTQSAMDSQFAHYSGQKLIVEYKEVWVESAAKWKKNMLKLKALIMEDKIMVEKKWQDAIPVDNIAMFILSSNEAKPIQLDSIDSGNRRWTIIKTGKEIKRHEKNAEWICWEDIARAVENPEIVADFLAYLNNKFPTIKELSALENDDKKQLEFLSESVWNLFFKWVEKKFPEVNKISNFERDILLDIYREEIDEREPWDSRYFIRYLNENLSMRYEICKPVIRGKQERGYKINKIVDGDGCLPIKITQDTFKIYAKTWEFLDSNETNLWQ